MRYITICFTLLLSLVLIYSCGTDSPPVYQVILSSQPAEAGSVTPAAAEVEEGKQLQIRATPNQNWLFTGWQGDHTGSANEATLTVMSNMAITALFEKVQHPLTVNTTGSGSVSQEVISSKTDYDHGTVVRLTADPDEFWNFIEWQGSHTGSENTVDIEINGPKVITAVFEINTYSLTTSVQGEGSLNVNPDKDIYKHGESVELTAAAAQGWTFTGWTGDYTGDDNPLSITMESDKLITAVFEQEFYEVNITSSSGGTVTYQPVKDKYVYGDKIQLQATPAAETEFIRWQGALTTRKQNETFTVTGNHTINALFQGVLEAVKQRWGSLSSINNFLLSAGLSLENGLPETITVTSFRLFNQNGALVGQSSETHNVAPGSALTYTISFNMNVTTQTFSSYTGDWLFTYKGKNYRKTAQAGVFGQASKEASGDGGTNIEIETFDP